MNNRENLINIEYKFDILNCIRVATSSPKSFKLGDIEYNKDIIVEKTIEAAEKGVQIICFPELSLTGYSISDLFMNQKIITDTKIAINDIAMETGENDIIVIVGAPIEKDNQLFNCAVIIGNGRVMGIVPKTHIPTYSEFYEGRHFASSTRRLSDKYNFDGKDYIVPFTPEFMLNIGNEVNIAVELCEDLWVPIPPSSHHAVNGAHIIFNLSASNELLGKKEYRFELVKNQSARCLAAYAYVSANTYESTSDVVFSGHQIIAVNGDVVKESHGFSDEKEEIIMADIDFGKLKYERKKMTSYMENSGERKNYSVENYFFERSIFSISDNLWEIYNNPSINRTPFSNNMNDTKLKDIINIQCEALIRRLTHINCKNVVIGVSGGLDSTLAVLVCVEAFRKMKWDLKGIHGITMPCFGTTSRTKNNAVNLMENLGITVKEIDIKNTVNSHYSDIGLPVEDKSSLTFENGQARYRTMILMNYSGLVNGIVIGTGNMSEAMLGWCTYNGDHMAMFNLNIGIPKTLVKSIIGYFRDMFMNNSEADVGKEIADTIQSIIDTKISPELLPVNEDGENEQDTEKSIGSYDLNDFFMYHTLRNGFAPSKIILLTKYAFKDEYSYKEIGERLKFFYKRFFMNQFKRNCTPDGVKVGSVSLSPRGDWRMPSDASVDMWIREVDEFVNVKLYS